MMRKTLCVAAVAALLLVSTPASAEWAIQKHPLGPGWTVSNGTYVVYAGRKIGQEGCQSAQRSW